MYKFKKGTMKRMKISEYPDIEISLLNWFIPCRDFKYSDKRTNFKDEGFFLLNFATNNLKLVKVG